MWHRWNQSIPLQRQISSDLQFEAISHLKNLKWFSTVLYSSMLRGKMQSPRSSPSSSGSLECDSRRRAALGKDLHGSRASSKPSGWWEMPFVPSYPSTLRPFVVQGPATRHESELSEISYNKTGRRGTVLYCTAQIQGSQASTGP